MRVGEEELRTTMEEIYTVGGNVWVVLECGRKRFRIEVGQEGTRAYDNSRRAIVELRIKGEKLMLERAFQHQE